MRGPLRAEQLWGEMYRRTFCVQGGGPVVFGGMSTIDEALCDIKDKTLGVPVFQLVGRARVRQAARLPIGKHECLHIE